MPTKDELLAELAKQQKTLPGPIGDILGESTKQAAEPEQLIEFLVTTIGIPATVALTVKDVILGDVKTYIQLQGNITFAQFIMEEAIQTASFPIFTLLREGDFGGARKQIETVKALNAELKALNGTIGVLSPLSFKAFRLFAEATDSTIAVWEERAKEGGEAEATGQISPAIYDRRTIEG